jgi:hypothetical protein
MIRRTATSVASYLAVMAVLPWLVCDSAEAQKTARFTQEEFAIGFWVDPPMDDKAEARYQEIADAHFSLVLGGFGANTVEKAQRQLELCQKHGMGALVISHGCEPTELPDGPACWGYKLRDEPNASDFADLRARADAIRAARPGKLVFVNLFPNYANEKQLGTPTYDEHVARFCEVYQPEVLSMDHYPVFKPNGDGRDGYCANLAVMRKYALQEDLPFWNFFNIMPYGPHTDPTEAQVRWQIYTSIAYGAKGVLYFCYYTPFSHEFPKGGAIIGRDDRKTRHWYQARRTNEQIRNLGPTLMKLTSTGVHRVKPGDDVAQALKGTPIKSLSRADHDPEFDLLIGVFKHTDGRRAVLLNNYHFAFGQWPTVEFDVAHAGVMEVDKWSGKEAPVIDDSPDMEGLQISLEDGEGRLFLLPGV